MLGLHSLHVAIGEFTQCYLAEEEASCKPKVSQTTLACAEAIVVLEHSPNCGKTNRGVGICNSSIKPQYRDYWGLK